MHRTLADLPAHLLDPLRRLPDRTLPAGLLVVEGAEAVRWLLRSTVTVDLVLAKESTYAALAEDLQARAQRPVIGLANRRELAELLGFAFDRGVIALAQRPASIGLVDRPAGADRLLVADGVHDPTNLGSLIRTARCLGLDGLVLGPGCADPWYRRCTRVSVGHVFHLPLYQSEALLSDLTALQAQGWRLIAAHRGPLSQPVGPRAAPWALVLGNEDRGVSPELASAADERLFVPMQVGTDSINLGVAAGIMAYALGLSN